MRSELEGIVNEAVRDDFAVTATEMPLAQAKALGAQAMFGEKYGEVVRMVELNGPWSRELCGGTHVRSTAQIGLVDLIGEGSVGSGIRRVEALVSTDAFSQFASERALVSTLADTLKTQPDQLVDRVEKLLGELKAAEKQIADLRQRELLSNLDALVAAGVQAGAVTCIGTCLPGVSGGDARTLAMALRDKLAAQPAVIALIGGDAKPALVVATTWACPRIGCCGWSAGGARGGPTGGQGWRQG